MKKYIQSNLLIGILFLVVFYLTSLTIICFKGLSFSFLVAVNWLVALLVLFIYYEVFSKDFFRYGVLVFLAGFAVELIGVQTGKIFGEYSFGTNLGFSLKEIPVLIGVNWLLLSLSSAYISNLFLKNIYVKSLLAALLVVVAYFFIEKVVSVFNFWFWKQNTAPLQSYVARFVIAFFFQLMIWSLSINVKNKIAPFIYSIQILFFFALLLCYKFNIIG